jgi:hypothetical protein
MLAVTGVTVNATLFLSTGITTKIRMASGTLST